VILSGRGRVEVGDDLTALVGHGDVVLIPPGCRQRITNTGDGELVFLAVCTPRYNDAVYEDVDGASPGSDPSAPTPLPPPEDG
jgi:mannose-6-phosphate isomerase-like protein (cupin superfamily)